MLESYECPVGDPGPGDTHLAAKTCPTHSDGQAQPPQLWRPGFGRLQQMCVQPPTKGLSLVIG